MQQQTNNESHQTSPEKQHQAAKNEKYDDDGSKQIWQRILHKEVPKNDIIRTYGMVIGGVIL